MSKAATEIIVALDVDSTAAALTLVAAIGDNVSWYKVGKQLFTREGPTVVKALTARGKKVFLDLKFHDIPNTVAQAVTSAAAAGAAMTNVHAGGGPAMLKAAADAAAKQQILLVAVTVLTSMDAAELAAVGQPADPQAQVMRLATLAQNCAIAGVVCSAHEISALRQSCGNDFVLVVPGIRPAGTDHADQKRVMTPGEAAAAGADYLVIGRPITGAADPAAAAAAIRNELAIRH